MNGRRMHPRKIGSASELARSMATSVTAILVCLSFAILTGCAKVNISGLVKKVTTTTPDFLLSQITTNGPGVADGRTALTITVLLENSDHSLVVGYQPTYVITSGAGVTTGACTASSATGISTCSLWATQPGTKDFELTNAKVDLASSALFNAIVSALSEGALAGSVVAGKTGSLYTVDVAAGGLAGQAMPQGTTSGGYTVNMNIQGILHQ